MGTIQVRIIGSRRDVLNRCREPVSQLLSLGRQHPHAT